MALATFYHPDLDQQTSVATLCAAESSHAIKSRRLREGALIQLINGRGLLAQGTIESATKREVMVKISDITEHKKPRSLSVATAIPKGDRQRSMIDMLSQLGVSRIIPINCERSVTNYKTVMFEKWQRLVVEACKQSQNPWLAEIEKAMDVEQVLQLTDVILMHADAQGQTVDQLKDGLAESGNEMLVLIGPEGGFSEQELTLLKQSHSRAIKLSDNILRTELANICAVAQLSTI